MNARMPRLAACISGLVLLPAAQGREPVNPGELKLTKVEATAMWLSWRNAVPSKEVYRFEIERTINGTAQPTPIAFKATAPWKYDVAATPLQPDTEYCFRVHARHLRDGESAGSSNQACARTLPHPPLAPLDVRAFRRPTLDTAAPGIVEWKTPDQSGYRRITSYSVERQSNPGPNRPWLNEGSVAGPDGAQTATTRMTFNLKSAELAAKGEHVFRVCAVNDGGRTCARPVALVSTDATQEARLPPGKGNFSTPDRTRQVQSQPRQQPTAAAGNAAAVRNSETVRPPMPIASGDATADGHSPAPSPTEGAGASNRLEADRWGDPGPPIAAPALPPNTGRYVAPKAAAPVRPARLPEAPSSLRPSP